MVKDLDLSLDYLVKDIEQADFGRKEMQLSEREMPGLMECIKKYGPEKPLKRIRKALSFADYEAAVQELFDRCAFLPDGAFSPAQ